ncbi:hypothetical protein LBMAG49_01750 [Planctomycetota bacterium]|nr:hypothetical protein LBMAG49_01750 [Planctomycetota bacterium]
MRTPSKGCLLVIVAIFVYALLSNAWVVDDAYITFRSVSNWHDGFGLRWNVGERVQVYTHPLWMLIISLGYLLTNEFFYTAIAISGLLCVATIWLMLRLLSSEDKWKFIPFVLLLLGSKAFMDFTSSGLENPLSYFFVVLFYGPFLLSSMPAPIDSRSLRHYVTYFGLIASLAFVNRIDTVLLFAPALSYIVFKSVRLLKWRLTGPILIGAAPALAWLLFSLVYYGFPFPNTYYAKSAYIGIAAADFLRQGFAYYINSLAWDPPTLGAIAILLVLAIREGNAKIRCGAAGLVLYLLYVLRVGASGTHMSGRFFSVPYLLAIVLLMALPISRRAGTAISALAIALIFFCPMSPMKANTGDYHSGGEGTGSGRNGILDTRFLVQRHDGSSLFNFERMKEMPNMRWHDEGRLFHESPEQVKVGGSNAAVGFFGFAAGPNKTIIDTFGLTDALLARLPTRSVNWYGGHFERKIPDGYEESVRSNKNLIVDPDLRAYYGKLLLVTQESIFSSARFRAIWELNSGSADSLLRAYAERH